MSGLAALLAGHNPPGVYQWHNAVPAVDVQHAVEHAGWTFRYLDGWTVEDQQTFFKSVAACLDTDGVGEDSGAGFEVLDQHLEAAEVGGHGMILLWDGWSPLARHDEECFEGALAAFRRRTDATERGKLAVLLRGDGPTLDLEELPIRH